MMYGETFYGRHSAQQDTQNKEELQQRNRLGTVSRRTTMVHKQKQKKKKKKNKKNNKKTNTFIHNKTPSKNVFRSNVKVKDKSVSRLETLTLK